MSYWKLCKRTISSYIPFNHWPRVKCGLQSCGKYVNADKARTRTITLTLNPTLFLTLFTRFMLRILTSRSLLKEWFVKLLDPT